MNINFDIISLTFLTLYVLYILYKNVSTSRPLNSANYFILLDVMFFILIVVAQVCYISDQITMLQFSTIVKSVLVGVYGVLFTQIILMKIFPYTKQKVKVLWRIPMIAVLVGYYLEFEYLPILCGGYWLISLLALVVKYKEYRILIPNVTLYLLPIVGMIYIDMNRLWILNIMILVLIKISINVWNTSVINMKFKIEESKSA